MYLEIKSPLTNRQTKLIKEISINEIIENYRTQFNIEVASYFNGINKLKLFECIETGYQFFYPFNISGDGHFYEQLQEFDWYYMPWKWEHEEASKLIKANMKVLEVGCAEGNFLQNIRKKYECGVVGLELNEHACVSAKGKGIEVYNETVQEHSLRDSLKYDFVCSFQVLEHIFDVKSFIESQYKLLKHGGLLTISVPNNSSFLGRSENILNMPPHHVGLWNKKSLISLARLFNMEIYKVSLEPLQEYHKKYFDNTVISMLNSSIEHFSFIVKPIVHLLRPFFSTNFKAFTIQITFKKV